MTLRDDVQKALSQVKHPDTGEAVTGLGMIEEVEAQDGEVTITVRLSGDTERPRERLGMIVRAAISAVAGVSSVQVHWKTDMRPREARPDDPIPGVRNVVLVMSGKGGVGKSTVASNLALALARSGGRIGLLDADIYGPSMPTMFGVSDRPTSTDEHRIAPLVRFGVKLMSIGFMLDDPKTAVVWRGPMVSSALQQFVKEVAWGELDTLVMDLPPGTGDVALTLSQTLAVTGAVIVTTPQPVATDDVYKSVSMCGKVGIPILGVVENMSWFVDTAGVRHELFGNGGGRAVADFAKVPLLGQVPIDQSVREGGDRGVPVVQGAPGSAIAKCFLELADALADRIAEHNAPRGPTIDRSGGTGRRRLPVMKG